MSNSYKYQRHIDGLRAVAVLSVVFYHFDLPSFGGGFVGVDVFFVISGYLITKLITEEISQTGDFDFKRFYIRRMRRLFPALAVTFLASLILATALFSPERFQAFGRSLSAAVFSVSNILFWTESGYFDADSHLKPLLHTWSLSVEEQFYLIWPALLWFFAQRSGSGSQFYVLAIVGVGSFGLNYLWVSGHFDAQYASTIFYLTPFRIFELVIGAMAIFAAPLFPGRRWLHEVGMLIGLVLIAYSVTAYSDDIIFPYYYALIPCLGAFAVILSRESRSFGWLVSNPLAVGIGLISYSMYLIHWPALVFYEYYKFEALGQFEYAALFLLTTLLSVLMYFFVEKPLRRAAPTRSNPSPQRAFVLCSGAAMIVIALMGAHVHVSQGRTWGNANALSAMRVTEGKNRRFELVKSGCNLTRLDQPRYCKMDRPYQILVIGNSHEPDGYNIFARIYGRDPAVNLISFGTFNLCDIEMTAAGPVSVKKDKRCIERVALLNDQSFVSQLDGLVYSANKPFSANKKVDWLILHHLRGMNKNIPLVVLGGFINTLRDCSELFNRFGTFAACRDPRHIAYNPFNERNLYLAKTADLDFDFLYIDKTKLLCTSKIITSCKIQAGEDPAFWDKHHLSLPYATLLGQRIADSYTQDLRRFGFPPLAPAK
ncbi:MAG: hypothetical protein DRQ97_01665 [Gammaproteobacteria bacterium]|nr:MAG: hypothetical protein DRQ97_01665 [Gammaproteobacteria bacterium]